MAGGGPEYGEIEGGVEEDDKYPQQGGGEAAGARIFLQSCHSVGAAIWVREMGGYPRHVPGPGGFQYKVARLLMGRILRRWSGRKWEYT